MEGLEGWDVAEDNGCFMVNAQRQLRYLSADEETLVI